MLTPRGGIVRRFGRRGPGLAAAELWRQCLDNASSAWPRAGSA